MLSKRRDFSDCAIRPETFLDDLLVALPLYGVKELWRGRPLAGREKGLGRALDVINANAWKRHSKTKGKDNCKSYGLMRIAGLLSPSILGLYDGFWSAVAMNRSYGGVLWRSDGVYLLTNLPQNAKRLLNDELELDYARFVKASAKLIAKKLQQ